MLLGLVLLEVWPSANKFWLVRLSEPIAEDAIDDLEVASATSVIKVTDNKTLIVWAGAESRASEFFARGAYLVMNAYPDVGCGKQTDEVRPYTR